MFFFSLQTRRLAESIEDLISSLAQLTGKLWSCKMVRKSTSFSYTGRKRVNFYPNV